MIKLPQPSMVLNAPDAPTRYVMHVTYDVKATEDIDISLRQVRQAALRQKNKKLRCLVINCHGIYDGPKGQQTGGYGLALGKGIYARTVHHFGLLRNTTEDPSALVDHIFITACGTAAVSKVNAAGDGNGVVLCKNIAKHSGANVTAANIVQISWPGQETPYHISGFEGRARTWDANGNVTWDAEYSRWPHQGLVYGDN